MEIKVHCCDCKCYELMTCNNQHFCNKFGGYVTADDYCSRYELLSNKKEIEGEQGMSYYIASLSCGNDSMAMVYELIRRGYPLDEIIFYSNVKVECKTIYQETKLKN